MCGFVGFIDKESVANKKKNLKNCMDRIIHRGPDSSGSFVDKKIALGFRRLSIVDLSSNGDQPMYNEDKSLVITFNGEIYNYKDLKKELINKGHEFKNNCDTEVIIHGYEEYGVKILDKLRGMFAFVIWDIKKEQLFGARDFYGIKPFYYSKTDNLFIFGSEIKSFISHFNFKMEMNDNALRPFLTFQYSTQDETFFKDVYRLNPGHYFIYKDGNLKINQFYEYKFDEKDDTLDNYVKKIDKSLKESIDVHKTGDVPIASFLSGGIDSSYVTKCLMPDKTFSVGFENKKYSEVENAKELSKMLNIENISKTIGPDEFFDSIPEIQYYSDEPHANLSAVPLYFLSKLASKYVKVVLSGEGADELFAGYFEYEIKYPGDVYRKLPGGFRFLVGKIVKHLPVFKGRKFLMQNGLPLEEYYIGRATVFEERESNAILRKPYKSSISVKEMVTPFYNKSKGLDELTRKQTLDYYFWLPNDILLKADKMTMAHSLELRVPFLDKKVVEVATSIPSKYRLMNNMSKYPLRMAAEGQLPEEWTKRVKIGFPVPFMVWIKEEKYYKKILDVFNYDFVDKFFDRKKIIKLLDDNYNGIKNNSKKIYSLYVFLIWYKVYFVDGGLK